MADEENKDIETTDEDASAAGPDAGEDTSSSQAAAEEPTPAPPAEDASPADDPQDDAPEESADAPSEAPVADAGGDTSEEDNLPWKEKRRLEKSRRPHEPGPQLSPEERAAKRLEEQKSRAGQRRKQRSAERAKKAAAGTGTPPAEHEANAAKVRQGIVVSDKGEKSITVRVDIVRRHRVYEKVVRRSRTLHAHDERNEAGEGDVVRVVETRPLSKTKRWRLVEVVEKAR
jgi:small subunit ribosomal protein S17